ncbi:hypothetical protein AL755_16245 [Arthrobacter sp. ERGS1:01]|uniref:DUF6541 family protein n=1 Tax=Arthrobacter sp. ERGS1:01 TaxID=1704044 RepID=UPI0006B489C5|nr:DUF6541 family protein [Arthrobacter sp. ERGS1:01]ALE06651.1 hypothetical protein AL755_16245 [Arthrobacter sp. ERGS1:01]
MTWLETFPTLVVAAAIVFIPGAILARVIGARGITWLALSAPLTITLVGVGAIAAQIIHVRWTLPALLLVTVGASAVTWAVRYLVEIRRTRESSPLWVRPPLPVWLGLLGGLAVAVVVIGHRLKTIFIHPGNISQTYDNVFHLNAVRFILDSGNGSSLYLGNLGTSGAKSFYPGAWHDLVALVVQASGSSIPVGVNAVNIILAAAVWTISAMYLATRVLGSRPAVYLVTGVLAGAFSAFPYLLMDFGVLYPNFLAITLLPVMMGLIADVLRLSKGRNPGAVRAAVLMVFALPGVALSHPSIAIVLGAFALPAIALWIYRQLRSCLARTLSWYWLFVSVAAGIVFYLVLKYVWLTFRPSAKASFWPPIQTVPQALGEAISNAPMGRPLSWVVATLTVVGIYALVRNGRHLWLLGMLAAGVYLFVVVSGFKAGEQRSSLTGVFYNDSYRLAALLPAAGLAVCVFGTIWLFDLLCSRLKLTPALGRKPWMAVMAGGTVAALAVGFLAQDDSIRTTVAHARSAYSISANAPLLSTDEAALIARTDRTIPADATVIVSPATGASLVYALENRRVILPAVGSTLTPDDQMVVKHLTQLATNPAVCSAVRALDSYFVLDFGSKQINGMRNPFPTSAQLAETPGLTLIDQQGPAKLYRIDGCKH